MKTQTRSFTLVGWPLPFPLLLALRWSAIALVVPLLGQLAWYAYAGEIATAQDGSSRLLDCLTGPICLVILGGAVAYYRLAHHRNDGIIPSDDGKRYFSGDAIISGLASVAATYALVMGYVHGFKTGMNILFEPISYIVFGLCAEIYLFPMIPSLLQAMGRSKFKAVRYLAGE